MRPVPRWVRPHVGADPWPRVDARPSAGRRWSTVSEDAAVVGLIAAVLVALALSLAWVHPEQQPEPATITTPTAAPAVIYDP